MSVPEDGLVTTTPTASVSGITKPQATLTVTGGAEDDLIEADAHGRFTLDMSLREGENRLAVTAFDDNGQETTVERTIFYTKEALE